MTFYALILFLHIASALLLFAGLILEWTAFRFLRGSIDTSGVQQWVRVTSFSAKLYGPAIGVIILTGGYLGAVLKAWNQPWLPTSFLVLIVVGAVGAAVTGPRVRALKKAAIGASSTTSSDLSTRMQDPVLLASARLRVALILGVLLLMVSKVDLRLSLLISLSALVLGLLASLPLWRRRQGLAKNNGPSRV